MFRSVDLHQLYCIISYTSSPVLLIKVYGLKRAKFLKYFIDHVAVILSIIYSTINNIIILT